MKKKEIELKNFEDEYMIKVKGGKYKPSFANELKEVFDIEVCKYPTTQKMWLEVMDYNPSKFEGIYKPIDSVTWWEALEFCNKLSEKYSLEPVYDLSKSKQGLLTIKELKKTIKEQKNIGEDTRIYLSELAKRYSFPFASFIVAFIGLSISSKYVRGGRTTMNLIICVVAGYGYYLVSGAFEAMSLNGILNPFIASWIPNILYLIIGIYFMNRAEY